MPTIKFALTAAIKKLKYSPSPTLDAEVLLSFVIKKPREFLYAHPEHIINSAMNTKFNSLIKKCAQREPIAYLTKNKEFFGLNFYVDKNVLIPRPLTESLAEKVLENINAHQAKLKKIIIIDVGTGSGAIPIAILKNLNPNIFKKTTGLATDISSSALKIARQNSKFHNLNKKITFFKGNLLSPILTNKKINRLFPNSYIIITANLPYIPNDEYLKLDKTIKKYEPKSALIAGADGLKYYRELFEQIKNHDYLYNLLRDNHGFMTLECERAQVKKLRKIFLNINLNLLVG